MIGFLLIYTEYRQIVKFTEIQLHVLVIAHSYLITYRSCPMVRKKRPLLAIVWLLYRGCEAIAYHYQNFAARIVRFFTSALNKLLIARHKIIINDHRSKN